MEVPIFKARFWIDATLVPVLLFLTGCSTSNWSLATTPRPLPPERLMSIARKLENQGHLNQAKDIYQQVLASDPAFPKAQESLDTLIANESNPQFFKNRKNSGFPLNQPDQLLSQSKPSTEVEARPIVLLEEPAPSKTILTASANPDSSLPSFKTESDFDPFTKLTEKPVPLHSAEATEISKPAEISNPFDVAAQSAGDSTDSMMPDEISPSPISDPVISSSQDTEDVDESALDVSLPSPISDAADAATQDIEGDEKSVEEGRVPALSAIADPVASALEDDIRFEEPGRPETVEKSQDAREVEDRGRSQESSRVIELPKPSDSDSNETIEKDLEDIRESIQVEKTINRRVRIADPELEQFFGPFRKSLVQTLRANRERYQSKMAIIAADQDAEVEVRARAIFLLGAIGPAAIEVVPVLRRELHYDVDEFLRVDLAEAILKIQPADEDATQFLVDSLKDSNEDVKWMAAFALRNVANPRRAVVIDALIESLKTLEPLDNDDLKFRRVVFLTLAEFGSASAKVVPELKVALKSRDPATREVAKVSLSSISR